MCWLLAYTYIPRAFRKFIGIREKFHRRKSLRVFRPLMRRLNTDVSLILANSKRTRKHRRVFIVFPCLFLATKLRHDRSKGGWRGRERASCKLNSYVRACNECRFFLFLYVFRKTRPELLLFRGEMQDADESSMETRGLLRIEVGSCICLLFLIVV